MLVGLSNRGQAIDVNPFYAAAGSQPCRLYALALLVGDLHADLHITESNGQPSSSLYTECEIIYPDLSLRFFYGPSPDLTLLCCIPLL